MSEHLIPELAERGLELQAAIDVADIGDAVEHALRAESIDVTHYRSLVLLAQAGRSFWDLQVRANQSAADPFDDSARDLVERWFDAHHPVADWQIVYPGPAMLPLGQLAQAVGWGRSSPLGLTIHPTYGLWIAHRMAFLTDLEFATSTRTPLDVHHACSTCRDTPCIDACPVGAVSIVDTFDLTSCAHHRVSEASVCAHQCLARNACPTGSEFRYGDEQMRHHYDSGLASILRWLSEGDR